MGDLRNPRWLYLKGGLFVLLGVLAAGLILIEQPTLRVAGLLFLSIWAFARAYYFTFYVVEHYIDGSFRYAGLTSFVRHWWANRRSLTRGRPKEADR